MLICPQCLFQKGLLLGKANIPVGVGGACARMDYVTEVFGCTIWKGYCAFRCMRENHVI